MQYLKDPTQPIWLFGENRGNTLSNNSWYAFRHLVSRRYMPVKAYFVTKPTREHKRIVSQLPPSARRRVLWRGSPRHVAIFNRADRFFIALSFGDIEPPQIKGESSRRVPLVHLQHGTTGLKRVGYRGEYYRGTIDAFCVYNDEEAELLSRHNGFRADQLFQAIYHPRYQELLSRQKAVPANSGQLFWFLTWRDYMNEPSAESPLAENEALFVSNLVATILHPNTRQLLIKERRQLDICFHQFFAPTVVSRVRELFFAELDKAQDSGHPSVWRLRGLVTFHHASDVDVMDLMVEAEHLITDYSSLPYDFTLLGKSVSLYRFDVDEYLSHRESYVDLRAVFTDHVAYEAEDFAQNVTSARGTPHPHYVSRVRMPDADEQKSIKQGRYIDMLFDSMLLRDAPVRSNAHTSQTSRRVERLPRSLGS